MFKSATIVLFRIYNTIILGMWLIEVFYDLPLTWFIQQHSSQRIGQDKIRSADVTHVIINSAIIKAPASLFMQ
jgi:hypothetical protein